MLDDDLGWSLGVVFRTYARIADTLMSSVPGGPRGFQVLTAATAEEPVFQGALAHRIGIDRTVMTYLVDELEAAGLVERRAGTKDRRNKQIVATGHGTGLLADLQHRLGKAEDHVLEPLSAAERTRFRRLLRKLAVRAQDLDPVADACALVEELDAAPHPARAGKPPAQVAPCLAGCAGSDRRDGPVRCRRDASDRGASRFTWRRACAGALPRRGSPCRPRLR